MNVRQTIAKVYCHFFGHTLTFKLGGGRNVRGRSGLIALRCVNGCGFDSPEVPGKPGEGY